MADKTEHLDSSLLSNYIENIATIQRSIQELQAEQAQLRTDARTDGFNLEAVQMLSQIVSKSAHDGGVGLLHDIVKYAHQIGLALDTVSVTVAVDSKENGTDTTMADNDMNPSSYRAIRKPI
ncbi:MAG: hypothetical protein OEQ39_22865, partial [Gammaproteobacteria bacterium]|nr:hypothetical protein [Gammaproteobacteria bacterium]